MIVRDYQVNGEEVRFRCPKCDGLCQSELKLAGQIGRCTHCGYELVSPGEKEQERKRSAVLWIVGCFLVLFMVVACRHSVPLFDVMLKMLGV